MLLSWSCLSYMRPSCIAVLNRLLLESGAASFLLFNASQSSLSHGVTAEEVVAEHLTNPNFSRLTVLSAESSLCVTSNVRTPPLQPADNAGDRQEWHQEVWMVLHMSPLVTWQPLISHTMNA